MLVLMVESEPRDDRMKKELKELIRKVEKIISDLMDVITEVLETEIKYMVDLTTAEKMLKLAAGNLKTVEEELRSLTD